MPLPLPFQVRAVPIPVPLQFNRADIHVYRVRDALGNIEADFDNEKSAALFCAAANALPALVEAIEIAQHYKEVKTMPVETIKKLQVSEGWQEVTLQNAERDLFAALDALNSKEPQQ